MRKIIKDLRVAVWDVHLTLFPVVAWVHKKYECIPADSPIINKLLSWTEIPNVFALFYLCSSWLHWEAWEGPSLDRGQCRERTQTNSLSRADKDNPNRSRALFKKRHFIIEGRKHVFGCERKNSSKCYSCNVCSTFQDENRSCLSRSYSDPSFYEECKAEYLKQREEYRATGIKKKKRQTLTSNV